MGVLTTAVKDFDINFDSLMTNLKEHHSITQMNEEFYMYVMVAPFGKNTRFKKLAGRPIFIEFSDINVI